MGTTGACVKRAATTAPEPAWAGSGVVTVNPSLLFLLSLSKPKGYCIALIAVVSRSLTLSGNGV